jgi:1,4-dihydroxy-2-naphthoate octaprenyltransferase
LHSNIDKLLKIIRLGRLKFPINRFLLFSFGALLATISGEDFDLNRFLFGYAILFAAHLSVSYSNDYFDFDTDKHGKPTKISGGSGILPNNPELRRFSKWFAILLMSLSIIFAIIFAILFFFPIPFVAFVILGNLIGWFYAAPPLRLAYRGLGEIAAMVAIGLMMPGMGYFVLKKSLDSVFLVFILPSIFLACAFIISVEIPDMEVDWLGNKKTLIVRKGRKFGFKLIALLVSLVTSYFVVVSMAKLLQSKISFHLLTLLSLIPLAFGLLGLIRQPDDRELATKLATHNLSAFSIFLLLVNCYLFILL